jgi:hypothetical protein
MAILKAKARQSTAVTREPEGEDVYLRALRDGSLSTVDFFTAMALEGRCFMANAGTATTPIAFGAGSTGIVTTEADLLVVVPNGTTIIPISLVIYNEAYGTNAIYECLAAYGSGGTTTQPTNATAVTPVNLRSDSPRGTSCTLWKSGDAAGATYITTNIVEFFRDGLQSAITKATAVANVANADQFRFSWSAVETGVVPIIVGSQQLFVFSQAQEATGFIQFCYCELPSSVV